MKLDESIRVHIRESEGCFVASCLELAIVTQGRTLDETIANVKEAVCLYLDDEDLEYIGVVRHPRILLTMELETASA